MDMEGGEVEDELANMSLNEILVKILSHFGSSSSISSPTCWEINFGGHFRVLEADSRRINREIETCKEDIKANKEKIKLNKQLPYLVATVVEILDLPPEEEDAEQDGANGANVDLDSQRSGLSVVVKASTRQAELQRLNREIETCKEDIKANKEKIKLNKQLPYLVATIVEELEGQPVEMDTVSIIATFPAELREEVLLTSSDAVLANLTPALVAEATMLRQRVAHRYHSRTLFGMYPRNRRGESSRRGDALGSSVNRAGGNLASRRSIGGKLIEAEGAPLVDTEALKALIRLLRIVQPFYKGQLQKLLLNLCAHHETRAGLVQILMDMLMLDTRKPIHHSSGGSEPSYRLYSCQSYVMFSRLQFLDGVPPLVSHRILETLTYLARNHPNVAKLLLQLELPCSTARKLHGSDQGRGKDVMVMEEDAKQHQEGDASVVLLLSLLNLPLYLREQLLNLLEVVIDNAESRSSMSSTTTEVSPTKQPSGPEITTSDARLNSDAGASSDVISSKSETSKPSKFGANKDCDVHQDYILEDSYNQLRMRSTQELKGRLTVHFQGEEGIDAGGLTREWYQLLSRVIFDKGALLFTTVGNESTFQPNPNSVYQTEHLSYFKFVGRVGGKALFDGQLLDVHFTRSFFKHILGVKMIYHDIEAIDPDYFKNLKWMLENDISDVLDLTFSMDADEEKLILYEKAEVTDYELIPGGRNIRVTEENKHEYVDLVAEHRLTTAIRPQINAFLEGFNELILWELMSMFNDKELELLISGLPDIDLDDMRANTEYSGFSEASRIWEVAQGFSKEDKACLLQFVTGTSKVPVEGFSALQGISGSQLFQIHKAYDSPDQLPSAHTCFNQLDLPAYTHKGVLLYGPPDGISRGVNRAVMEQLVKLYRESQMGLPQNIDMSSTVFIEPLPVIDVIVRGTLILGNVQADFDALSADTRTILTNSKTHSGIRMVPVFSGLKVEKFSKKLFVNKYFVAVLAGPYKSACQILNALEANARQTSASIDIDFLTHDLKARMDEYYRLKGKRMMGTEIILVALNREKKLVMRGFGYQITQVGRFLICFGAAHFNVTKCYARGSWAEDVGYKYVRGRYRGDLLAGEVRQIHHAAMEKVKKACPKQSVGGVHQFAEIRVLNGALHTEVKQGFIGEVYECIT